MDRPRTARITVNAYGTDAAAIRRLAELAPHASLNGIALRAIRAGLPLVEAELLDTARKLVAEHDSESGL